jgi:hypothetical protein
MSSLSVELIHVGNETDATLPGQLQQLEVTSDRIDLRSIVGADGKACPSRLSMELGLAAARRETLSVYQHIALDGDLEEKYQTTMKDVEL